MTVAPIMDLKDLMQGVYWSDRGGMGRLARLQCKRRKGRGHEGGGGWVDAKMSK